MNHHCTVLWRTEDESTIAKQRNEPFVSQQRAFVAAIHNADLEPGNEQPSPPPPARAHAQVPAKALAQADLGQQTPLGCKQQQPDGLAVVVKLTNTTKHTLPAGTRVHWQTQTGIADWVTVTSARGLPPKGALTGISPDWLKGGPCKAHVFKQPEPARSEYTRKVPQQP